MVIDIIIDTIEDANMENQGFEVTKNMVLREKNYNKIHENGVLVCKWFFERERCDILFSVGMLLFFCINLS